MRKAPAGKARVLDNPGESEEGMDTIARPDIKPAFATGNVPVAMATDAKYLPYLDVAVNSILANTKNGNIDLLVLIDGIGEDVQRDFIGRFTGVSNLSIRFIDLGVAVRLLDVGKYKQSLGSHFTTASLYRLLLPQLLTSYEKTLYLDIDVCVCGDIADLYSTDIGDCYLGGVNDLGIERSVAERAGYAEWGRVNGFCEWEDYINSGVLIMNLAAFRAENGILERLVSIAIAGSEHFPVQDALNFICKGRIRHLGFEWNLMTVPHCMRIWQGKIGRNAKVFHYCDKQKPWDHPEMPYAQIWWRHVPAEYGVEMWRRALGGRPQVSIGDGIAVSVIMPIWNAETYLAQALISCCVQALKNIEIICIDDGSTDDSLRIVQSLQKLDSRIKLICQQHLGPGVARNAGLDIAAGEYIFFLDADDRFVPGDALSRAYEQAKRDDLDMLIAASTIIAEDGQVFQTDVGINRELVPGERFFGPDEMGSALFLCTSMGPGAKLFRRAFLVENKLRFPALMRSEDFPVVELALTLSSRIGMFAQSIHEHRTGVVLSLESTKDETPLIFFEAEQILRDSLKQRGLWNRFKTAVCSAFVSRLAYNLQAVQSYQSFLAIIDKYRQEQRQWISWEDVDLPEWLESKQQLVKDIAKAMDDDDRIALFVKVRESATKRMVSTFWKAKVAKRDERIAQLQKQLGATREVRNAALKERDSLRKNLYATREVRDAALKERDSLRGTLDATRQVRDAALKERNSLKKTLEAVRAVRDTALRERDALRANIASAAKSRDGAIAERNAVRRELDALRKVFGEVEKICGIEKGDA